MSLSLQMAAGDDKDVVWCIRMRSEGTNIITNGTFDSGASWTPTADWSIGGGVATYDYVSVASENLTQTVPAVSSVPYILEYEITEIVGDGFTLILAGGGTSIIADHTNPLPITVGQHRYIIQCVATKTAFVLHTAAFEGTDKLSIDNIKLRKLEEVTYLATKTLSLDNTWDGQVLEFNNRISDIDAFVDTLSSGTIGGVNSYTFTVARYNSNSKFDGWFEEFYPTYNGGTLISRECEIGIVWAGASADTEITWLMRGKIVDYRYEKGKMIITVLQSTEIDARPLPYYTVQKDFDNEVSYFTNAPEENYGIILPIVYGDFVLTLETVGNFPPFGLLHRSSFPLVLVDKYQLKYIAATHKFWADGLSVAGASANRKYLSGLGTYMNLTCDNGSSTNNDIIVSVTHFDTLNSTDNVVKGSLFIIPTLPGTKNDISNYSNLTNIAPGTDSLTITQNNEVALIIDGNESGIGTISRSAGSVTIDVWQSDSNPDNANNDTIITYWNPEFNKGTGSYGLEDATAQFNWQSGSGDIHHTQDISEEFSGRDINDEPWSIEEILNLEFIVRSMSGFTNKYETLWIVINNITVADARKTIKASRLGK